MKNKVLVSFVIAAMAFLAASCSVVSGGTIPSPSPAPGGDTSLPSVGITFPADLAVNAPLNRKITAVFSKAMDASSINIATVSLKIGSTTVAGTSVYAASTWTFTPTANLASNTVYTATITSGVKDLVGNAMAATKTWTFTTGSTLASGPAPVNLGTAGNFVILAKSGISTVPSSVITGNVGVSPVAATYLTGFSLIQDSTNVFATSTQVTGKIYASNYAVPSPANMTTAISDMETAYTDAAGRTTPDFTELYTGDISGKTLVPGLYKWSTGVLASTDFTLNGGPNDTWIFQISGDVTFSPAALMHLTGGALAKNVFWQTFGVVTINTTAHLEGIVLAQTAISLSTGASVNGRLLAQTAVTLNQNIVAQPAP